jgi:prolipoprotein diacylglyceryltransferase
LFLLLFTASFDNVVSRGIAKAIDKPVDWVNEKSSGGMVVVGALAGVIVAGLVFASFPVAAIVLAVVAVTAFVVGVGMLAGWWGPSSGKATKPDNVSLNGKM